MKTCCVSIKALYNKFGEHLPSGNCIELSQYNDHYYYDLRDEWGNLVCMDGEECEIVYELSSRKYKLTNRNDELDTTFYLTKEEINCAAFGC